MKKTHNYNTNINWIGNTGQGTFNYNSYGRCFEINTENKPTLLGSSDPTFLGDSSKHNPEELLLAAISSCHMLWYLHLCANEKIVVTNYSDNASATMDENENGSGKFTSAVLNPIVTITDASKEELAKSLHIKANAMCFIANSLNFKVQHLPIIKIENR